MIPGLGRSAGEGIGYPIQYSWVSLVAQLVKNPPAMQNTWARSLGWEDPLEKGMATHSSILDPCLENPMDRGVWRATVYEVGHDRGTERTQSDLFLRFQKPAARRTDNLCITNEGLGCIGRQYYNVLPSSGTCLSSESSFTIC